VFGGSTVVDWSRSLMWEGDLMPIQRKMWRLDESGPVEVSMGAIDLEKRIEDVVEADPSVVDPDVLIIGRQVQTDQSGLIDLLGLSADGSIVVMELKRGRTPRDVVAQALDYASWACHLGMDELREIWDGYSGPESPESLDDVYADRFNWQLEDPDGAHRMVIVASELDSSTERIVDYLADTAGVEINVALFGVFKDGGNEYLVRTWLREIEEDSVGKPKKPKRAQAPWDGHTWAVNFGEEAFRSWEDGKHWGFVSAGGGDWYVRTLKNLSPGHQVACVIPGVGYVAVGTVTRSMRRVDVATVPTEEGEVPFLELDLKAAKPDQFLSDPDDRLAEHIVLVDWSDARPANEAVWEKHMYANQNTVTKLRHARTIEVLRDAFIWPSPDNPE